MQVRVDPQSDLSESTSWPKRAFAGDVKVTENQLEGSAAPVIQHRAATCEATREEHVAS